MIVVEYPYWNGDPLLIYAVPYKDPRDGYFYNRWSWIFLLED